MGYNISVIVPVYNQEEYIYRNLHEAIKEFSLYGGDFEIILVDDGSTDNTVHEASLVKDKHVKIVSYSPNRGKGYALKTGFSYVTGDVVTFMDADLDIHPRNLVRFFPYLEKADMVIGSKRHKYSKVKYPLRRKVLSYVYHQFVNALFNLRVSDTQSGLKLIRRKCLAAILPKVTVKQFAFDLEMIVNARKMGYKVAEAPIELKYNFSAGSHVSSQAIKGIFLDTLGIAYRLYILRYYDRNHPVISENVRLIDGKKREKPSNMIRRSSGRSKPSTAGGYSSDDNIPDMGSEPDRLKEQWRNNIQSDQKAA